MKTSRKIRAGVVGVGHLGRHHARIYDQLPETTLTAVADTCTETLYANTEKYHCHKSNDYKQLAELVEIASVAVPTTAHFEIASYLMRKGVHVLVEKPITSHVDQGRQLVDLSHACKRVLMVGHSERFNPAVTAAAALVTDPRFFEVHRIGPFSSRATDVNVITDLMIHDIDLILNWTQSEVTDLKASGVPVLSPHIDIANARLEFASGCVANITASRVSFNAMRKIRIFQPASYLTIDCLNRSIGFFRKKEGDIHPQDPMDTIQTVPVDIPDTEPLTAEIQAFIQAVTGSQPVAVSGEAGLNALKLCTRITNLINT